MEEKKPLKVGQYALVVKDNTVLVLERSCSKTWSLPGGRLNADERDWFLAFKREIAEETGIEIEGAKPFSIEIVEDDWQLVESLKF